ncbi:MAG: TRAP transporter large permease [Pararhodobacter sp.]
MTGLATAIGAMLGLMALRIPVFLAMALGVAAFAIAFWPVMRPEVIAQSFLRGLEGQAFTAIAYFFAVGAIMNAGGMSGRLLDLARTLIAHRPGGLAHANIGASMLFAGVSGSAVADAAAVGSVMVPAMRKDGYDPAYAAAVTASSATIGLVIPPSIPMVVFALFTPADVARLFVAGILPGLMMGLFLMAASIVIARARGYPSQPRAGWAAVAVAARRSVLALLLPVLVVWGMVSGVATVSEIGAVAAVYAAFVTLVVYREVTPLGLWRALVEAAVDCAKILIIIAVAGAFVWISARMGVAAGIVSVIEAAGLSPLMFLAALALALLILGTVLEPVTLLIVVAPVVTPAALAIGVDITQLGIVFVLAGAIGLVTPPVGILLFMAAAQANVPLAAVVREGAIFLAALLAVLALIVVFPGLTAGVANAVGL